MGAMAFRRPTSIAPRSAEHIRRSDEGPTMYDSPNTWRSGARPTALLSSLIFVLVLPPPGAFAAEESTRDASEASTDPGGHAHEHKHEDDRHPIHETIVVTATPLAHDRDELAVPVERVDRRELLEHLGSTLGETLSHVPGITSTGFSAGASRPVVRGQDAYRTEVLEDGLRTQDVSRESPDHAVPVNPLAARRVEVVRGAATLRYGGGASAGVVNVITNRIPDRKGEAGLRGEVFGGIGLLANERDLAASLDGTTGPFAWHADGLFRRANDYAIPNDDRPRIQSGTGIESWMGSLGGSYFGSAGRIGVAYTRAENVYGIPEDGEPVEIDMHTDRFRFEADLEELLPGLRSVRVRGVYSDYEHDEIAGGEVGQTYRNEEFEGRVEALHDEILGFTGAIGLHGRHRDFRAEGEAAEFLAPAETSTTALYVFEERTLRDELTLETGFRVEHTRVQGSDLTGRHRDLDFVPLSGSIGLVAKPLSGLTIGLTTSIGQRAPAQVELFARGPHEATQTFEIGSPDLDEETSYTGEFRIGFTTERGRIEWSGFATRYEDFIFANATGELVDEDGNPVAAGPDALELIRYRNRDATFLGTELAGEIDLLQLDCGSLGLDGRFDYVRARFDAIGAGGRNEVPRIVPIRWGLGAYFESEDLSARVGFLRTEAQQAIGDFERATNGFTYLNASLSYRLALFEGAPLELSVVARNLTDVRGRNHVSFNKDEVLLPGRNIRFGARARF